MFFLMIILWIFLKYPCASSHSCSRSLELKFSGNAYLMSTVLSHLNTHLRVHIGKCEHIRFHICSIWLHFESLDFSPFGFRNTVHYSAKTLPNLCGNVFRHVRVRKFFSQTEKLLLQPKHLPVVVDSKLKL